MIPHDIHAIWLGAAMPDQLAAYLETWRRHHPAWGVRVWSSPDELELRNRGLIDKAPSLTPEASIPQFISDVMRYEILEQHGGVYVDCDMECLRPIDLLVEDVECFAAWELQDRWIGNAILGAAPGALFMQRLIEMLPWSVESNRRKRPNISTGPQFLTRQYRGHEEELTVLPQAWCYPAAWHEFQRSTEDFPRAWTKHHWGNARRKAGMPL